MRFSSIFQRPLPSLPAGPQSPAGETDSVAPSAEAAATPAEAGARTAEVGLPAAAGIHQPVPAVDIPTPDELDLDARVRLLGEWQLGEA